MSGGSLSSRVSNMKFMQSAGDRQKNEAKAAVDQQETKKLKDLSEWSLPVNVRTMKVIKAKSKKVRKLGYSTISAMGPVNDITDRDTPVIGRKTMTIPTEAVADTDKASSDSTETASTESTEKVKKSKKSKKSKKKSSAIDAFKSTSDDDFDPNEVDPTSKSLLNLWKSKKN